MAAVTNIITEKNSKRAFVFACILIFLMSKNVFSNSDSNSISLFCQIKKDKNKTPIAWSFIFDLKSKLIRSFFLVSLLSSPLDELD
ncbi:MAG: hypothetical protein RI945_391 [Candidatus Parcubacteria bacterium]|jgi:hypothetical protein